MAPQSEGPQRTDVTMCVTMKCLRYKTSNLLAGRCRAVQPAHQRHGQHGHRHSARLRDNLSAPHRLLSILASQVQALAAADSPGMARPPEQDDGVPTTLPEALSVFVRHPSTILALVVISSLTILRSSCGPVQLQDIIVVVAACAIWIAQEWAIHRYLLHSSFSWLGKAIHEAHHAQPYHHVSIDTPPVVAGFMAGAGGMACLLLQGDTALICSACISYFTTGLLSYQLIHYLVHTKWVPQSAYMRTVRQHHMRHHMRNHDYWFAFSAPQMDALCGTLPSHPGKVPLKIIPRAVVPSPFGGAVSCHVTHSSSGHQTAINSSHQVLVADGQQTAAPENTGACSAQCTAGSIALEEEGAPDPKPTPVMASTHASR